MRTEIIKSFEDFIGSKKVRENFELLAREKLLKNLKLDYFKEIDVKLGFLRENSALAKKLGIVEENPSTKNFNPIISMVNSSVDKLNNERYYLRGYKAIDEEIRLITSRVDHESFIVGYIKALQGIREILQDQSIEEFQVIFNATPINSDKFAAVYYDTNSMSITNENTSVKIISLVIFFSYLIFTCFFAIVYHRYFNYIKYMNTSKN